MVVTNIVQMETVDIVVGYQIGDQIGHIGTIACIIGVHTIIIPPTDIVVNTCFGMLALVVFILNGNQPSMNTNSLCMSGSDQFL